MQYMLLTYLDEKAWLSLSEAQRQEIVAEPMQYVRKLAADGKFLGGAPLDPTSDASTVRVRDGKKLVTDGPFAETREQLGGFFMVEAKDLDEAIAIAGRIPGARKGTVEIRPVVELPGLPGNS